MEPQAEHVGRGVGRCSEKVPTILTKTVGPFMSSVTTAKLRRKNYLPLGVQGREGGRGQKGRGRGGLVNFNITTTISTVGEEGDFQRESIVW